MGHKILCAIDGTDHSHRALDMAAEMAGKLGAGLTICSVNVVMGSGRGPLISAKPDAEVEAIVRAGLHGELNRRIRVAAATADVGGGVVPADAGPVPPRRFLAGGHDIAAFADEADDLARQVIEDLYAELTRR